VSKTSSSDLPIPAADQIAGILPDGPSSFLDSRFTPFRIPLFRRRIAQNPRRLAGETISPGERFRAPPQHRALLYYMLQKVQQFQSLGEDFAVQHKDSEYLGELKEELQTAVLEATPAEKRLRGLPPEEVGRFDAN
jgi:hypothetical protein